MKNITLEEVIQTYGVENWGAGYFEVNRKGHLAVRPAEGDSRSVDIKELIDDLIDARKLQLPILLRFPQILTNQLKKVQRSFQDASREFNYSGGHFGVFQMKDLLKLLHFHIGSQITDIKRVKAAMKEAARVYSKIRQMHIDVEFLDIGGGMGVDYDGSKTTFESSVNYTIQEFANDVVYTIKSVCDDE